MLLALAGPAHATDICLAAPYTSPDAASVRALMDRVAPILADYPSLAQALADQSPVICLSDSTFAALGYFEPETNRVVIDAGLDPDFQLAILLHELRHVEQFSRGLCPDMTLAMEQYARNIWAMEADANAVGLLITWGLRERGDPGPWQALADWPGVADLSVQFETVMAETADVAAASAAAFAQWYENPERRERYYVASCSAYLDQLEDTHALPQYGSLREDFLRELCVLPDGQAFPCIESQTRAR